MSDADQGMAPTGLTIEQVMSLRAKGPEIWEAVISVLQRHMEAALPPDAEHPSAAPRRQPKRFGCGALHNEQFTLLLKGTSVRGEQMIEALRAHLVDGKAAPAAIEHYQVNKSHFYKRLKGIRTEHERTVELMRFYVGA